MFYITILINNRLFPCTILLIDGFSGRTLELFEVRNYSLYVIYVWINLS